MKLKQSEFIVKQLNDENKEARPRGDAGLI